MIPGLACVTLAIWLWLWLGHGAFWWIERAPVPDAPAVWPEVVAVIPARNEEEGISETLRSLWAQDYARPLRIVLVDDDSEDRTAELDRKSTRLNSSHSS